MDNDPRAQHSRGLPSELPLALRGLGLCMEQTGCAQRLVPHWLLRGSMLGITEEHLRSMMAVLQAPVVRRDGEKGISKRTLVWSLILKEFPDKTIEEQGDMWLRLVGEPAKDLGAPAPLLKKCLESLPPDEQQYDFKPLREKLDRIEMEQRWSEFQTRQRSSQKTKEYETPDCLKKLSPVHSGARLVFDQNATAFEAYYPAGKPTRSVSMSWSGARTMDRNPLTCLMYCVDHLWNNHIEKKRVTFASICNTFSISHSYST